MIRYEKFNEYLKSIFLQLYNFRENLVKVKKKVKSAGCKNRVYILARNF